MKHEDENTHAHQNVREHRFKPIYEKSDKHVTLFSINPSHMFWTGFIPPLFGALIAIGAALTIHQRNVTNYNWICGRAFLPSLSRIINLDFEGVFWQLFIYFHAPFRMIELTVGFWRYGRLCLPDTNWPRLFYLARWTYLIFGTIEVVFLVLLSAVGEKEHGVWHILFFYPFGVFAFIFFVSNTICHSQSLYYLKPYGRLSYRLKLVFTCMYLLSVPMIGMFHAMYWKGCIKVAYELFAITEYMDVFVSMAFHACAFLDIRHKVIFQVKYVPRRNRLTESESAKINKPMELIDREERRDRRG